MKTFLKTIRDILIFIFIVELIIIFFTHVKGYPEAANSILIILAYPFIIISVIGIIIYNIVNKKKVIKSEYRGVYFMECRACKKEINNLS